MNSKERLLKVLSGTHADRPPLICPGGMMNMVVTELMEKYDIHWPEAHYDGKMMADLCRAVVKEGLFENYGVPFCMSVEAEGMGAEADMGSDNYEPHIKSYPMSNMEDIASIHRMDLNSGRAKAVLDAIRELKNGEVPVVGNVPGPVSIATSLVDPTRFYVALKKNSEASHRLLRFVTEEAGRFALEQVRAGADIITIADPSGTGEILGPKYFDEYMVKYLNEMIKTIRTDSDVPVIVHICGQMNKVFEELNKVEASAFSFDAMVSIESAKKFFNKPIMGNISTYAIEQASPEHVRMMTKSKVDRGTDIIAPACGLGLASPLNNIKQIMEGIRDAENNCTPS